MGLPAAGKTTFLAALWHVAESEEVPSSLILEKLSDDAKHLNQIKGAWLQYSKVGRTNPNSEQIVSMLLRDRDGARMGEIVFPDLSGETFRRQWTDRCWTAEYASLAERAVGVILFVHPDQISTPFTIAQAHQMLEAADPQDPDEAKSQVHALFMEEVQEEIADHDPSAGAVDEPNHGVEGQPVATNGQAELATVWSPDKATPQVQLVELLQFLTSRSSSDRQIRLAVVISAWDKVEDIAAEHVTGDAEKWIRERTPLLYQYLVCNEDQFHISFYALSAQGGDTKDPESCTRWRHTHHKSECVFIAGPDCSPHDITEPVRRVLGFRG
jgi:hypothetical protein